MKLYAGFITAQKPTTIATEIGDLVTDGLAKRLAEFLKPDIEIRPSVVLSDSEEDAIKAFRKLAHETYPESEGWVNQEVGILEVPDAVVAAAFVSQNTRRKKTNPSDVQTLHWILQKNLDNSVKSFSRSHGIVLHFVPGKTLREVHKKFWGDSVEPIIEINEGLDIWFTDPDGGRQHLVEGQFELDYELNKSDTLTYKILYEHRSIECVIEFEN